MFESSVVETRAIKSPFGRVRGLNLSVMAHVCAAIAWLATGLVHVNFPTEPPDQWQSYTLELLVKTPPPAPPPPPPPRSAPQSAPEELVEMAPTIIPDLIPEVAPAGADDSNQETTMNEAGVIGGVEGGVMGGVIGGLLQGEIGGRLGGVVGSVTVERQPGDPLVIGRDMPLPVKVRRRAYPIYPRDGQLRGIEGTVILRYLIDKQGKVANVEVIRPSKFRPFTASAVDAIGAWEFEPFMENGQPIEVVHELTVHFQLVPQ